MLNLFLSPFFEKSCFSCFQDGFSGMDLLSALKLEQYNPYACSRIESALFPIQSKKNSFTTDK